MTQAEGRVALVTGANGDLGRAVAADLARRGGSVVLVVRRPEQGEALQRELVAATGNPEVSFLSADLADLAQVRALAAAFRARFSRLHVLVNNAGVHLQERRLTREGLETHFAVNHLAWFLLTNLLLDPLKAGAPARVVNVASQIMADTRKVPFGGPPHPATLELDNLQGERHFEALDAYGRSKLAMVMCGYALARRLEGSGVTVNALHPGVIATSLSGAMLPPVLRPFSGLVRRAMLTPEAGARNVVRLASAPELARTTGKYFDQQTEARSPERSYDVELQERLWEASAALVGLAEPTKRLAATSPG